MDGGFSTVSEVQFGQSETILRAAYADPGALGLYRRDLKVKTIGSFGQEKNSGFCETPLQGGALLLRSKPFSPGKTRDPAIAGDSATIPARDNPCDYASFCCF